MQNARLNKAGHAPLVLRVTYPNERRDLYTGIYCDPLQWNADAGKVQMTYSDAEAINRNIELISYKAMQALDQLRYSGEVFTNQAFKKIL